MLTKKISFMESNQKIPKCVFMTHKFDYENLPQVVKDNMEYIKNKGYEVRYYSDSNARKFIEENFPEYLKEYDTLIPGAYKADLLRLLLLYKYGGVYNDIGHSYLVAFEKFISDESLIVCKDQGLEGLPPYFLHNAFIASVPEHPMIKKAINVISENIGNRFYGNIALDPTGPGAFGKAFNLHFGRKDDEPINVGMFDSDTKVMNHPGVVIKDIDDTDIIKTKFDNYYEIIYPNGKDKEYYAELWNQRKIYLG